MHAGSVKILHPTARRFGMSGFTADEIANKAGAWAEPMRTILMDPDRAHAEQAATAKRSEIIGGSVTDLMSYWDYLHGNVTRQQFDATPPGTVTERFIRWWSCANKTAPTGVPNALAQGACYIRNMGLVVGGILGVGFILFALKEVGGLMRRRCRKNPDLIILSNPAPKPPAAWGRFHLTDTDRARMTHADDIPGVPKIVAALGLMEAVELVYRGAETTIKFRPTTTNGPWLVMDSAMKRLWIVSRDSEMRDLSGRTGAKVKAVFYYPTKNSGKYEAGRPYRHEFGEGGRLPSRRWPEAYPTLRRIAPGHRAFRLANGRFHINERGIVG